MNLEQMKDNIKLKGKTMGENNLDTRDETECHYLSYRQDCDGDYDTYCTSSESCPHKKIVKDCDGDYVSLCAMH